MTDENSSSDPFPYLQIHRTVEVLAANLASACGLPDAIAGWGLIRFWRRCADPREIQRLYEEGKRAVVLDGPSLSRRLTIAFGKDLDHDMLVELGVLAKEGKAYRVRGASRYFEALEARLKAIEGGKRGGLKSAELRKAGNPPSTPPSSGGQPSREKRVESREKKEEEKKKTPRALSDKEECWDLMEAARVEHCQRLELPPGKCQRPKLCNKQVSEALTSTGITDDVITGSTRVSGLEYLQILFEEYLRGDFGRTDKDGAQRDAPWPIGVFLSPNVLANCKRKYEAEEQAA